MEIEFCKMSLSNINFPFSQRITTYKQVTEFVVQSANSSGLNHYVNVESSIDIWSKGSDLIQETPGSSQQEGRRGSHFMSIITYCLVANASKVP